jgi:hypothetical protein
MTGVGCVGRRVRVAPGASGGGWAALLGCHIAALMARRRRSSRFSMLVLAWPLRDDEHADGGLGALAGGLEDLGLC